MTVCRTVSFSLLLLLAVSAHAAGPAPAAASCAAGPTTLCLSNQRFKLAVQWKDFNNNTGFGQAVPLTSDTGYFWFFNSSNVELVVKVLDGRGLNGKFWVFFGALSNVEYSMTVTDTVTGNVKTYFNPSGRFASVGDTEAFSPSGVAGPAQKTYTGVSAASILARPAAEAVSTCVASETSLCLNGGRFRVEVKWKDFAGKAGVGHAIPLTSDTGYFWFFDRNNVELVVKALDARGLNGRFWIFYGALSNVEYEMTVTDTLTGNVNRYSNPSGRFASVGDTDGFRAGYRVAARLDESRAVSMAMPITGGTISATAANGTVFTLTVPVGALLSDEKITMTPVAAIDGLPLSGGLAAAVDLAPAGLRLFQLATLTITPAVPVPIADEVTFAWRGTGEEFFLYPPDLGTRNISMKLMHFSGYGVGRGSAADQVAQQQRAPASPEDALSQRIQDLLSKRRRVQFSALKTSLAAQDPDFFIKLEAELRQYYDSVLASELEVARKNCSRSKAIVPRALGWARQVQLLGFDAAFQKEINNVMSALVDALVNCYNESFDRCVSENDPTQVQQLLGFARQLALLGAEDRVDFNKVERCARFELNFESVIQELPAGEPLAFRHQVRAIVPILFSFTGLHGSAPIEYLSAVTGPPPFCAITKTQLDPSVFQVLNLSINLNVFEGNGPPPNPLTMTYDPGSPKITFTTTCTIGPATSVNTFGPFTWWLGGYELLHGNPFIAEDWDRIGGGVYARKTYQQSSANYSETTIMILKHTPQ